MTSERMTPMMEQWHNCKKKAHDALLLFQMGEFLEAFYEDAETLALALELTLTKRGGIAMSGIPCVSKESAISRLLAKGFKIAVAEQVQDPKEAKGLVERKITAIFTPGTTLYALSDKASNYIAALSQVGTLFGLALLELTTGEFRVTECEKEEEILDELFRASPSEVVMIKKNTGKKQLAKTLLTFVEPWLFSHDYASSYLTRHFQLHNLDSFGLKGMVAGINAAGALLHYVHEELRMPVEHIRTIIAYRMEEALHIDRSALQTLKVTEELLPLLDATETPMGGRLLARWLTQPLLSCEKIRQRQDAIEAFVHSPLSTSLKGVRDLERLMMKISSSLATPKEYVALASSLEKVAEIREALTSFSPVALIEARNQLHDMKEAITCIREALLEEPASKIGEGEIFQRGYHKELDELRSLSHQGKNWLAQYQSEIREKSGIKNLKVHFNRVFGYYIEVSKGQADMMPSNFERRQTLAHSERFISPELKAYEEKILHAEESCEKLEKELFAALQKKVSSFRDQIFEMAKAVAFIDVSISLACTAKKNHFVRPLVDESSLLQIEGGRHPVVEAIVKEKFIPNDTHLDESRQMMLITGPNMAGKSTYIRQVALIVILAQMGSFVPATSAHIGLVDKIFTRIGANDDLFRGQSTFMVEMSETANILGHATDRSLVILDEIGRGTSTYDGLSIAWAVAEYLLMKEGRRAKTLFATHYGELTELTKLFSEVVNYHAAVAEEGGEIVFLHHIAPGAGLESYGIHVAKLAGLPLSVVARAKEILGKLEAKRGKRHAPSPSEQLTFF